MSAPGGGLSFQVTRENVLQARTAVMNEGYDLQYTVQQQRSGLTVGRCGGDPVSGDAAREFTNRFQAIANRMDEYAQNLIHAGKALAETARQYGYTEEEIAASFRPPDASA